MERVKTGIPGLDTLLTGGIPRDQLILVTGTSGTGKTILSCQYIHNGVVKYKENGVYLSFEEPAPIIKENMKVFGWDFEKLERQKRFAFIKYDPYHIEDVIDILESTIREVKAKRVVIDSISALGLHLRDREELRRMIFNISLSLRKLGCTTLLVSEIIPGSAGLSRYSVEEFVADGVIVFYYERVQATFNRSVQVWKLRSSAHSERLHPYRIDHHGITIYPEQEAFVKTK